MSSLALDSCRLWCGQTPLELAGLSDKVGMFRHHQSEAGMRNEQRISNGFSSVVKSCKWSRAEMEARHSYWWQCPQHWWPWWVQHNTREYHTYNCIDSSKEIRTGWGIHLMCHMLCTSNCTWHGVPAWRYLIVLCAKKLSQVARNLIWRKSNKYVATRQMICGLRAVKKHSVPTILPPTHAHTITCTVFAVWGTGCRMFWGNRMVYCRFEDESVEARLVRAQGLPPVSVPIRTGAR